MRKLTPHQAAVLTAVRDLREQTGQPPTCQDIATATGFRAPNVHHLVAALARKGRIKPGEVAIVWKHRGGEESVVWLRCEVVREVLLDMAKIWRRALKPRRKRSR